MTKQEKLETMGNIWIKNLNAIGIYPSKIECWKVNTRAKKRFGQCSKKNGKYTIEISAFLLEDDCPEKPLENTVCHELCHAVKGCMNHGDNWIKITELVNDCYNMNIKRCSTDEEKFGKEYAQIVKEERISEKKIYSCECEHCGKIYKRVGYRQPKWFAHSERFYCTPCYKKGYSGKLINKKIENIA